MVHPVLIVEDEPSIAELLALVLDDAGYRGIPCTRSSQALTMAKAEQPGVILLDLIMPPPNGWTVGAALRADPATATIPLVIMSAVVEDRVAQAAILLDTPYILPKPLDLDTLLTLIETVLAATPSVA